MNSDIITVKGLTLLTLEEARKLPKDILNMTGNTEFSFPMASWYLGTKGSKRDTMYYVNFQGEIIDPGSSTIGEHVNVKVSSSIGVRPVLILEAPHSRRFKKFSKFSFADKTWTMISKDRALCDTFIGTSPYARYLSINGEGEDAVYENECHGWRNVSYLTDYEWSDIRKFIMAWAYTHMPPEVIHVSIDGKAYACLPDTPEAKK